MDDATRQAILDAYRRTGNKSQVARETGIGRWIVRTVIEEAGDIPAPQPEEWQAAFRTWAEANNYPIPPELTLTQPAPELPHPQKVNIVAAAPSIQKIAYLSDIHIPYEDKPAVRAVLNYLSDYKPDVVILGGDIFDFYLVSDHDKDLGRSQTIQDEFDAGRYLFKAVDEIAPSVIFLQGNHEDRLMRVVGRNPGLYKLRALEFKSAAELPERWTVYPSQTHYRIGGLLILHGDLKGRGTSVKHAAAGMLSKLRTSCLFGHLHRFGTHYETDYEGTVRAGFANGHLSDVSEAKYITSPDWQSGFSTVNFGRNQDIFAVQQHLIINSRFIADGREWSL